MKRELILVISVFFVISAYSQIYLVGSFNNLDKPCSAGELKKIKNSDVYKIEVDVQAGKYQFTLVDKLGNKCKYGEDTIILKKKERLIFYAISIHQYICSAEKLYVIGKATGGWTIEFAEPMEMTKNKATFTTDFTAGNFSIVKINNEKILWNAIKSGDSKKTKISKGLHTVVFDFETFEISIKDK